MRHTLSVSLWVAFFTMAVLGRLSADPVKAIVASVTGAVEFAQPGSTSFSPLAKGQALEVGSVVRTGDDGVAIIQTTPGTAIQLGNNSNLKLNELAFSKSGSKVTERKARLELTSGVVSALVDPSTPKVTDFSIQTPQGGSAARGTFYTVMVKGGKTYVSVPEGNVAAVAKSARGSI
jgi:hypothetical protein